MPTAESTTRFSGDRLRALRRNIGLTRTQLAAGVGVTEPTVGTWERGEFEPSLRSMFQLIRVLDCSVDDLFASSPNDDPCAGNAGPSRTAPIQATRDGKA